MKALIIVLFIIGTQDCFSQNLLAPQAILENTFWIKSEKGTATSFVVERNGKEFLITARHVFNSKYKNGSKINFELNLDMKWKKFIGKYYTSEDTTIDILIIKCEERIQKIKPLEIATAKDFFISQDCAFFGFPYGLFYTNFNNSFLPFVKRAIFSAITDKITFLDGMNNPGFSGGPVVIKDLNDNQHKIVGVISGYYPQSNKLEIPSKTKKNKISYFENSGIIFCYNLQLVFGLLDSIN